MPIRYLSGAALGQLVLPPGSVVDVLAAAFRDSDVDSESPCVLTAPKSVLLPADGRYVMGTLSVSDDPAFVGVKTLVLNPHSPDQGLPLIDGIVTLIDSHSGAPRGFVDGKWVTGVRTAGLSLLAAQHLARPDSRTMSFLGCGVQAAAHLAAFSDVYPLEKVVLHGRGQANIDRLTGLARARGLSVHQVAEPGDAIRAGDIVVSSLTRIPGRGEFLDAHDVSPGAFATVTDLAEPWIQDSLPVFDRIVIDDCDQEATMEVKLADPAIVDGDLTDLVVGRVPGRTGDEERTAFIFRGLGLADMAIAALALVEAERVGLGHLIPDDA